MVRAFDLISKLKARLMYQLSSDIYFHKVNTKFKSQLPLRLVELNLKKKNSYLVSNFQPLSKWSQHNAINKGGGGGGEKREIM